MSGQYCLIPLFPSHSRRSVFVLFCAALLLGSVCAQDRSAVPKPAKIGGSTNYINAAGVKRAVSKAVKAAVTNPIVTPVDDAGWIAGYLPVFDASGNLEDSYLFQAGTPTNPEVGLGTTAPIFNMQFVATVDPASVDIDAYGQVGINFTGRRADGTLSAPTAVTNGDNLFTMNGRGWFQGVTPGTTSGFSQSSRANVKLFAAEPTGWTDTAQGTYITMATTKVGTVSTTEKIRITDAGNVGIGTTTPGGAASTSTPVVLEVNGIVKLTSGSDGGLIFQDGTSQTTGVPSCAAGQLPKWSGTTGWSCFTSLAVSSVVSETSPNNGILVGGISNNQLTLGIDPTVLQDRVSGVPCPSGQAISSISQTGAATCVAVGGNAVTFPVEWPGSTAYVPDPPSTPNGVLNVTNTAVGAPVPTNAFPDFADIPAAVYGMATGSETTSGVTGYATGANGIGVFGWAPNSASPAVAATGQTLGVFGYLPDSAAVESTLSYVLAAQSNAVAAEDCAGSTVACGIYGVGVKMKATKTGTTVGFGAELASASSVGLELIFDQELNGSTITGTVGNMIEATTNGGAPYFLVEGNGDVNISGKLTKGSGSFKIDHPLDPANKYLYHSFVESPDMMNIYNGVIVLDKRGKAVVQLPDYFEALNQDFRYQLTSIGAPGPNLYVSSEVKDNKFVIAGGKPGAKVSWQVTGIRHDAYAEANRIKVEEDKGEKRGTYLHPELFQKNPVLAKK